MTNEYMIHIVDDDNAIRQSLSLLMKSEGIPVKVYESAESFLNSYKQNKGECLLLDIRMPGMSGLELLDELRDLDISIPVIFITGHGDVSMAVQAMKAGATDFIEKPFDSDYLIRRTKDCLNECICLSNSIELKKQMNERLSRLTKRETQVMNLLVDGKHNKAIAHELNISVRTVELHRAKVMEKLNAHSLSDVVRTSILSS
ncbi:MAG: response regulator [Gammaproteobacteria bacterium]|nr:response regulator [Gammaproteobacteria bacterium]